MHLRPATLLTVLLTLASAVLAAPAGRPNLVAIVTDDLGRWAIGPYDNKEVHTPHLDRIAREGATFTRAFTNTPVCSPSRATYLSGLYPTEVKITDWINPDEAKAGLGLAAQTWPAVLQKSGYRTALIGKWHLGEQPQFHPTKLGFDHFMGFLNGGARTMDAPLERDGKEQPTKGPIADVITDDAIAFVQANRDRPFSLSLHFREPHLPYGPVAAVDSAHYKDLDPTIPNLPGLDVAQVKQATKAYYASISSVDRNVGRLLQALDELGLAQNTLLVFTSDHGYNEGRHYVKTKGNAQWIAGGVAGPTRGNMWDTSIMIPLLMRWPGKIEPGRKIDTMVSNVDFFRTYLGALGVQVPADARARGADFSNALRGAAAPPSGSGSVVFGQYDLHNASLAYMRMIRTDRYKLVRFFHANNMDELYDLQADPDELQNLARGPRAAELAAVRKDLQARLEVWMKSINDPLLTDPY
ncbi:MAG: sulfatase-like hydrolase/transferase [Verrucomicrobiota bacterium]